MNEKKTKESQPKEEIETPVEAMASSEEEMPGEVEPAEDAEQLREEIESLQKQLGEAQAKAAENLDGWRRSQAEFINYKNRVQRDREQEYVSMKGDIIRKLLPILDDMERALANRPEDNANPWASGLELITRKFQNVLDAEGVKRIEAKGKPFNPNFHEAISSEPSQEVESSHVIEVVQNGYMLGERVIRPAMVRVAQ